MIEIWILFICLIGVLIWYGEKILSLLIHLCQKEYTVSANSKVFLPPSSAIEHLQVAAHEEVNPK